VKTSLKPPVLSRLAEGENKGKKGFGEKGEREGGKVEGTEQSSKQNQ